TSPKCPPPYAHNYKTNLIFNPTTPLNYLNYIINKLNIILLISINPNFNNQSFIPQTLNKLHKIHQHINTSNYNIHLKINNNIKTNNINKI
ncbi:hypothetical protein GH868_30265, partial [Bacillus thuringiensis]|nr:hypothetical protein [Bacillus thuringiensis]